MSAKQNDADRQWAKDLLRSTRPRSQSKQYWQSLVQELQENTYELVPSVGEVIEPVSQLDQYKLEVQAKMQVRCPFGRILFDDNCMSVVDSFQGLASAGKGQFVSPTVNGAHLY